VWRVVASALPLLWRRNERELAIRVRAAMEANPWRRLGPIVDQTVREIDLIVPQVEHHARSLGQTELLELLRDVVEALRAPSTRSHPA
jgi:hypothetical protein